ncbi:MAG: vanadium-dependent haloperoxidase [Ginsengibacter sp.]
MRSKLNHPGAFKAALLCMLLSFFVGCKKDVKSPDPASLPNVYSENAANKNQHESAGVALDWYKLQLRILLERNSAFNGNYFGYIGIGLYESVRYGIKNSVSFSTKLYQMPAMPAKENNNGYHYQISANAAMASMVRSFFTGLTPGNIASIDSLENAYNQKLTPAEGSESFRRSQSFGRSIAAAIYNWYLTDNINTSNAGYVLPPAFPGSWVPTPPAFANPIAPYVSAARTFVAADLTAIAPPFPAAYSEDPNSDFYKIVKNVYDVSQSLTTEQKNIALYWVDQGNGVGYTPGGHDLSLVTQALEQTNASLYTAAEAYAKAGIAERDGGIVCFRSKYAYFLLRPVTYIRHLINPTWSSFIPTPPHPEYPAAHAAITGSVMEAVTKVLGDNVTFTDHTYDFRGWAPRTFTSLIQAAGEAGISRLYGGIHYLPSINAGLVLAHVVGSRIGDIQLHE